MSQTTPTLLYIDDDPALARLVERGLTRLGLKVVHAEGGAHGLDRIKEGGIDVVALDQYMPGLDGLETLERIMAIADAPPVVFVTASQDSSIAVTALKAGAADFIEKPFESELILRLVRSCLEDNDDAVDANAQRHRIQRRLESLTARERQVLDLIVQGASNKVIAANLAISPRTVEIYRANVMSKMRADSLSDLVRMTLSAGVT